MGPEGLPKQAFRNSPRTPGPPSFLSQKTQESMTELTDGQLLSDFLSGDPDAFSAIVARHQATLLRHARAILGAGAGYEDVVQEVFLKLAQSPPTLSPEAAADPGLGTVQLLSWLHKVTRNCCMDVLRSETRRKKREHEDRNQKYYKSRCSGICSFHC